MELGYVGAAFLPVVQKPLANAPWSEVPLVVVRVLNCGQHRFLSVSSYLINPAHAFPKSQVIECKFYLVFLVTCYFFYKLQKKNKKQWPERLLVHFLISSKFKSLL